MGSLLKRFKAQKFQGSGLWKKAQVAAMTTLACAWFSLIKSCVQAQGVSWDCNCNRQFIVVPYYNCTRSCGRLCLSCPVNSFNLLFVNCLRQRAVNVVVAVVQLPLAFARQSASLMAVASIRGAYLVAVSVRLVTVCWRLMAAGCTKLVVWRENQTAGAGVECILAATG